MYLCTILHSADMLSTVTFVYGRALISLRADFPCFSVANQGHATYLAVYACSAPGATSAATGM